MKLPSVLLKTLVAAALVVGVLAASTRAAATQRTPQALCPTVAKDSYPAIPVSWGRIVSWETRTDDRNDVDEHRVVLDGADAARIVTLTKRPSVVDNLLQSHLEISCKVFKIPRK